MAVLDTPSGRLRGELLREGDVGVTVHRGIPFAQPPVGALRLRPPVPAAPWAGERDATAFGPTAPQPPSFMAAFGEPQSEDCLTLNVWAPAEATGAPVMVWFHGGGFTGGSASTPWYDGRRLAARGVVVVTANYRLGPLGFLHLEPFGGEAYRGSANLGLADQTLALEWVHRNIEAFGGDPSQVTIFGESAGAMSVCAHLARPAAAGRFRRAIAQSGAARHARTPEVAEAVAARVLDALGVDRGRLERLADLPVEAFVEVQGRIGPEPGSESTDLPLLFAPTVDGYDLPQAPVQAVREGSASGVDLLIGTNADEMNLFVVLAHRGGGGAVGEEKLRRRLGKALQRLGRDLEVDEVEARYRRRIAEGEPMAVWSAIATDLVFRMPAIETADAQRPHGDVRMYLYTHPSTGFDGAFGAAHAMELPFTFDNTDARGVEMLEGPITPERRALAGRLGDAWASFGATGDPGTVDLGEWPLYGDDRATMVLDLEHRIELDPWAAERSVWYP
jgi:para-nitrobenzyl esterase